MLHWFPYMLNILKTYLSYTPSNRDAEKELNWIENARISLRTPQHSEISPKNKSTFSAAIENEIIAIALSLYDEYPGSRERDDIFFSGSFARQDSIHTAELQRLIKDGLALMEKSPDPAHELGHIIRSVRFAKLLYNQLGINNHNLDWGIIAAALAFHDSYRTKNLGFLYNSNARWRRMLRVFPIIVDLSIFSLYKRDSAGSCFLFLKKSRQRIPKSLRRKIAIAILGEHSLEVLQEKLYPGISNYKNIIFCADNLDLISLGRMCGTYRKTIADSSFDLHWCNRLSVLNLLFNITKMPRKPAFNMARDMYEIIQAITYRFVRDLYPKDALLLKEALIKGGWNGKE